MHPTASSEIKALSILHFAMFLGQLLFGIIAFTLVYSKKFFSPLMAEYSEVLVAMSILFGATGYFAGSIFFKRRIEQINRNYKPLPQKFNEYRGASIVRWALMEFAVLFCIILFMLTNDYTIITIAGILMTLFISCRPATQKIASDLEIGDTDLAQINKRIFF